MERIAVSGRWVLAASLVAASIALLLGLDRAGASARRAAPAVPLARLGVPVLLVHTDAGVTAAWRARGYRGRVVVHIGRFLHFVDADPDLVARTLLGAGSGAALDAALAATAGPRNHLRVAAALGAARRIVYVAPPAALRGRLETLGATADAVPVSITSQAFPRELGSACPTVEEPVLVEVNASWFDEPGAPDPAELLRRSGLSSDLVIASLAEDADDVSPAARDRLRAFAATLAGAAPEEAP